MQPYAYAKYLNNDTKKSASKNCNLTKLGENMKKVKQKYVLKNQLTMPKCIYLFIFLHEQLHSGRSDLADLSYSR